MNGLEILSFIMRLIELESDVLAKPSDRESIAKCVHELEQVTELGIGLPMHMKGYVGIRLLNISNSIERLLDTLDKKADEPESYVKLEFINIEEQVKFNKIVGEQIAILN